MTIITFKNPTNTYRIDAKKTRRGARIPCSRRSTDQIKVSKVNMLIREVGRSVKRKPEREEKEEEKGSGRKVGRRVKTQP